MYITEYSKTKKKNNNLDVREVIISKTAYNTRDKSTFFYTDQFGITFSVDFSPCEHSPQRNFWDILMIKFAT